MVSTKAVNIEQIPLVDYQRGFGNYKSWDDLLRKDSMLVRYLRAVCSVDQDRDSEKEYDEIKFLVHKLKCIGILLCDGSIKQKATEFFNLAQPQTDKQSIACSDKNLRQAFQFAIDFSTE